MGVLMRTFTAQKQTRSFYNFAFDNNLKFKNVQGHTENYTVKLTKHKS